MFSRSKRSPDRASAPAAPPKPASASEVFIARQPIMDEASQLRGYELLFRAAADDERFTGTPEFATARVITDAVCTFTLEVLTHGQPAFINITRQILLEGVPATLPPAQVVLEVLETVEVDAGVTEACQALKRAGYRLALDDYEPGTPHAALLPLADLVKIDFHRAADRAAAIQTARAARGGAPIPLVAECIETPEDFHAARSEGFTLFQGYFFGRPAVQRGRAIPEGQLGYLRLMQAMRDPDLPLPQLEALIKSDASLCYRVLRTVNSAGFGVRTEIHSIGEALVMLGRDPIRRWVTIWAMASLASGANSELLVLSIVRARMCEIVGQQSGNDERGAEGFLIGICSLLDAIFKAPMADIVAQFPLTPGVRAALLGEDNAGRRLLEAVIAYERGDWQTWKRLALRAGLRPELFATAAADALRWANDAHRQGAVSAAG